MANKGKKNFRNSLEVERYLYRVSQDIISGRLNAAAGNACARVCSEWIKAHSARQENEIILRLSGLEAAMKAKKGGENI